MLEDIFQINGLWVPDSDGNILLEWMSEVNWGRGRVTGCLGANLLTFMQHNAARQLAVLH